MPKMIQLRNVPDELHRKLKARAAMAGMSLSAYLIREIEKSARCPTPEEIRARIASRTPVKLSMSTAEAVRREREGR
ncbi:MAG: hypothetical protein D6696_00250 [Acidobacteria bacterium]|nr:MAG: hypothetical protein D6696_00250 [Acidobacteriota bacterium]